MKNLKLLRTKKSISQQALAAHLGLSQQAIYKYEKGLAEPSISTLIAMADYFEVTVDYLIARDAFSEGISDDKFAIGTELCSEMEEHMIAKLRTLPLSVRLHIVGLIEEI